MKNYIQRLRRIHRYALLVPLALLAVISVWPQVRPVQLVSLFARDLIELQFNVLLTCTLVTAGCLLLCRLSLLNYIHHLPDRELRMKNYLRLYTLKMAILFGAAVAALLPVFLMPEHYAYNFAGLGLLLVLVVTLVQKPVSARLERYVLFADPKKYPPVLVKEDSLEIPVP